MKNALGVIQLICVLVMVLSIAVIGYFSTEDMIKVDTAFAIIFLVIGICIYIICIAGSLGGADSLKYNTKANIILASISCIPLIITSIIHLIVGFNFPVSIIVYAIAWIVLVLFWPVESIGKDGDDGLCIIIIIVNKVR